jgi:hypothetical protein
MKNRIYKICEDTLKINDEEIKEVQEICEQQTSYMSPLKMATTRRQNELGEYNKKVLDKILELRKLLESGKTVGN